MGIQHWSVDEQIPSNPQDVQLQACFIAPKKGCDSSDASDVRPGLSGPHEFIWWFHLCFPVVEDVIEPAETYGNFNSKSHHWYMIHTSSSRVGPWWMGLFTSQQVIGQWIELRTHRWRSVNLWPPGAVDRPVSTPIWDLGNFPKLGNVGKRHWKSHLHT